MPPPPFLNKHELTYHYRNNIFKRISSERCIPMEKTRVCCSHLSWTNTSPLIITHICWDVEPSTAAWIDSQEKIEPPSPVSHQLSVAHQRALGLWTLFSPLAFCLAWSFPGLVYAATAPENSYVQIPRCVSETLWHYSLYLPWWFLGLRRS